MDVNSKRCKAYFNIAKEVSKLSTYSGSNAKLGCAVIYKHRVISTGTNSDKVHPLQAKYNVYRFSGSTPHKVHAEVASLIPLIKDKSIDWTQVKLFLYREKKSGTLGLSRPCKSCMALIRDLGIKQVYYTTDTGYAFESLV